MNEKSVLLQIEEDTEDVDGRGVDKIDGSEGKMQMSEFEEFSFCWRSMVQVGNTILKCRQCEYLIQLFKEKDLSDMFADKWQKYVINWWEISRNNLQLLDKLSEIQTKNALEEEHKNANIKYLIILTELLYAVDERKRHILTELPPVPENKTTFAAENDKNDTNRTIQFSNLISLYLIVSDEKLFNANAFEINRNILKKVLKNKQKLDKFIKTFFPNDEKVWQHWMELQQFLTNHFNNKQEQLQQNELIRSEESKEFYSFLQFLLNKNEFERKLKNISYVEFYKTYRYLYFHFKSKDDFEQIFVILLLNEQIDFKKCIKVQQKIVEKSLNWNFPNQWRRMLHLPLEVLKFQQYQLHCFYTESDKSAEWLDIDRETINRFDNILRNIIYYVINLLIRIEILKNIWIDELDQLSRDEEFLNNLLKILTSIDKNECYLLALPQVPKMNGIVPADAPNIKSNQLNDVVFNLHLFYKLFVNQKEDFGSWNKKMLKNISKNLYNLNGFMDDFIKNQNSEQFLLLWNEFKLFLKDENNLNGQNLFKKIHGNIIYDKNREWKDELQNVLPIEFCTKKAAIKNDKMHQMQIYIVLILNESIDGKCFIRNIDLSSNLTVICDTILFQLVNWFKIHSIDKICNSNLNISANHFKEITHSVEKLKENCKIGSKEFTIYNDLFIVLKNASEDKNNLKSIELLEEIQNKLKPISHSKNANQNAFLRKRQIIWDLYCFWRLFAWEYTFTKTKFCKWVYTISFLVCLNMNRFDSYFNTFLRRNANYNNLIENWNCLKELALQYIENYSETVKEDTFFGAFFNDDNFYFFNKFDYFLKIMNIKPLLLSRLYDSDFEAFEGFIFIFLDMPNSLKQIAHFICWQKMSHLNILSNCRQLYYLGLSNTFIKNKKDIFREFSWINQYKNKIEDFNNYFFAYEKLNNNSLDLAACLKEIEENKIETYFYLDDILLIPQSSFELKNNNNSLLIQWHQIFYLHSYFKIVIVNKLKEKSLIEKVQYLLEYINENIDEINEFINNYFENLEDVNTFKTNWSLIKENINKLSIENSTEFWNSFFHYFDVDHYWLRNFPVFKSFREVNDIYEVAKHVLLILLNVPLSEIFKDKYQKPWTLHDLFFFIFAYKVFYSNTQINPIISNKYDLIMDTFIKDLQYYDNENESSQGKVKSEFNQLDKCEKVAVIENLMEIIFFKNDGYFKVVFKLFISLLPLIDIFLDISLAIQFFLSNEMPYFYLTLGILLITGVATVTTEKLLKREVKWKPTYYVKLLGNEKLKYFFSFTQITIFLRTLNEALLQLKIKMDKTNSYLDYINYGDPEFLKKEIATMKYVEMCFEAIPQTILQLYIILIKNKSNPLQLLSILTSTCSAMFTVWGFISSRNPEEDASFIKNRILVLREFCFYGLRIISTSVILFMFSWPVLIIWMILRFLLDLALGILKKNYKINNYGLFNGIHSDLMDYKIYNILTLVEFWLGLVWFGYNLRYYSNSIYYDVLIFIVYPILLTIWTRLLCFDKFTYLLE